MLDSNLSLITNTIGFTLRYGAILAGGIALISVTNALQYRFARHRRYLQNLPTREDYRRDAFNTTVYGLIGLVCTYAFGMILYFLDVPSVFPMPDNSTGLWTWLSFPIALIGHDFYFYWSHRAFHHPFFYKHIHYLHHKARNTTPLTAMSVHFIEAMNHFSFLVVLTKVVMVPFPTVMALSCFSAVYDAITHSGYPYYPKFMYGKGWRWFFANSFHHHVHHTKGNQNYSLYFNYLDRLFGTQHPKYYAELEQMVEEKLSGPREDESHQNAA